MAVTDTGIMTRKIRPTTAFLNARDRWDHIQARIGFRRGRHRVQPGLYALGNPKPESPVFVSANYTLSFDALRSNLGGLDAYILVINTHGVNVWCAAGKGSFGTDEIVKRVKDTHLEKVVSHRRLILPQLGAPGVAAHAVRKETGFTVEYGPVRAADLPEYMQTRKATAEMRRVRFTLLDRLVLTPVEITISLLAFAIAAVVFYFLGGWTSVMAVLTVLLSGTVLFPVLLPWLPTKDFSTKGFFLGLLASLPFVVTFFLQPNSRTLFWQAAHSLGFLLLMSASIAFLALNFTGSSTFTSRIGVQREIKKYIPVMAGSFLAGLVFLILSIFIR